MKPKSRADGSGHFLAHAPTSPLHIEDRDYAAHCADVASLARASDEIPAGFIDDLTVTLAPSVWELSLGIPSWREDAAADLRAARQLATALTSSDLERDNLVRRALFAAARIVDERHDHIKRLASELEKRGMLTGDEIIRVLDGIPVKRDASPGPAATAVRQFLDGSLDSAPIRRRLVSASRDQIHELALAV